MGVADGVQANSRPAARSLGAAPPTPGGPALAPSDTSQADSPSDAALMNQTKLNLHNPVRGYKEDDDHQAVNDHKTSLVDKLIRTTLLTNTNPPPTLYGGTRRTTTT